MTPEEIRAHRAEIMRELDEAMDRQQLALTKLKNLQRRCSHPRKYHTTTMGENTEKCPDCGWSL